MNIEDSLDNLSQLHISQQRSLQAQVKQKFVIALQKLQSAETREIGISELKKLVDTYREPEHLRNYIAILKTLKPSSNSATKQHEILVISILTTIFKTQLIDPFDKPPSVLKTVFRMVEVLHGYFSDRSATVQQACARALLDLSSQCLGNQDNESIYSIIYSPLISLLKSGVDKGSQATAAACLNELISNCRRVNNQEMLNRLAPELLVVILKVNCEYHELFQAVSSMLQFKGLAFLQNRVLTFLAKVLAVVNGTRQQPNAGSLNSYMCKVHVCKIIQKLGVLLSQAEKNKLIDLKVQDALLQASRNRIIQVQLAASRALRAWKGEEILSPPKNGLISLEEKRNSKLKERSRSKDEHEKLEKQLTFMKEDLEKLVKGGWGANNRAKNYVKRGSGVGGGSHGKNELSPPSRSGGKSHKQHFEELRQYIKKGAEQHKNLDRFQLANQQPKKSARSPPRQAIRKASPRVDEPQFQMDEGDQMISQPRKKIGRSPPREMDEPQLQIDQGDQMVIQQLRKRGRSRQGKMKTSEMEEPQLLIDEGDQMVLLQPTKKAPEVKKKSSGSKFLQQAGISEQEANELMDHQETLMNQEKGMNIDYYTEKSQPLKYSNNQNNKAPHQPDKKKPTIQDFAIPLAPNKYPPSLPNKPNQKKPQKQQQMMMIQTNKSKVLSQEQIGELVQQYNLSQVSQNLNGIINESDLHMIEQSTPDASIDHGRSNIQQIREKQAQKKARQSIVDKFFKKQQQTQQPKSQVSSPLPLSQLSSSPPKIIQQQPNANSLNFTESLVSRNKSRQQIQFTLNPKDRFSSLRDEPRSQQKQIQQQIVMSEYEESVSKGQKLPTLKEPKQIKQQSSQLQGQQYQKLIKNPPKREALQSIKSRSEKDTSQYNAPIQSQTIDLGKQWLKILNLVQEGSINDAFEAALTLDDPIYLLRLMLMTKCPLRKLTAATVQHLWGKFLEIYSHRFIDVLTVGILGEAQELGLLSRCLSLQEMEEALLGLYQLSGMTKGKLSYNAAALYNTIERSLHPQ